MLTWTGKRSALVLAALLSLCTASMQAAPAPHPAMPDAPVFKTPDYQACVTKVSVNPGEAFDDALYWHDHGGGAAADHCAAMALLALNQPAQAASRLDRIARSPDAGSLANRAALLDQAGNAWLLARFPANAEASFSAALKLTPRDSDIWTDRARARAMQHNWPGAESDLTNALAFMRRPEIYVLRAAARKALNRLGDARADIDMALALDPRNAEALVERGSYRLMAGDKNGARADWRQVLVVAPDSAAAEEARRRIADLELHADR